MCPRGPWLSSLTINPHVSTALVWLHEPENPCLWFSESQFSRAPYWDDPFRPQLIGPGVDIKFQLSKWDSALGLAYSLKSQPDGTELEEKQNFSGHLLGRQGATVKRPGISWTDSSLLTRWGGRILSLAMALPQQGEQHGFLKRTYALCTHGKQRL